LIHEGHEVHEGRAVKDLLFREEVFAIVGAAIDVHRHLGPGFLEPVYQETLGIEFANRGIPFESQRILQIIYKGRPLTKTYIADFVCYGQIIVEIKALPKLTEAEEAQLLNYLKATGLRLGLLINFGSIGKLEWKRLIL
jgi:GxxExxY protein